MPPSAAPTRSRRTLWVGCGCGCAALLAIFSCCGLTAAIREGSDPYAEPGDEVAEASGGAGQPLAVRYTHDGPGRAVYVAWLRYMGTDPALMQGSITCRFEGATTGYHAPSGAVFPLGSNGFNAEVSPGVVRIGSEHLRAGESIACDGSIAEPYTFSGRLVTTQQPLRPSDLLDL